MYQIGDKIVYPMHGAGVIIDIEKKKDFSGEEQEYLILRIPIGHLRIAIPRNKMEEVGVRAVCTEEEMAHVMELLGGSMQAMSSNWNQRYRENLEKLKSGEIFEVANVVRDLTLLHREKGLSTGEKKMLTSAKNILISEMIIIEDLDPGTMDRRIEESIVST